MLFYFGFGTVLLISDCCAIVTFQESDTEKILYGLDDITGASDIIIVEGEMDKLAMEEAGFRNCVSVPDGAPASVSKKDLPPEDQDTKYQYLWNCKEFFEKASRIILATDGDPPGQALAEELARRLGRERFIFFSFDVMIM
nr:twinkle homolog protein, chloroplastic/mitochondrial [Ipomoea batatas]